MDCQMPEMNGYEATAQIRRLQGTTSGIPIIALTADAMSECRAKCLSAGMNDVMTKPIKIEDLTSALETWLPMRSLNGSC